MQVLKAQHYLWLRCVTVLFLILFVSCAASGEYEIETFNLGKDRSIELLASEDVEVSQSFYCQVKVDQKIVVPLFMICVDNNRGQLKFKTLLAEQGDLVGIFEQEYPQEILTIHDFRSNASWPRMLNGYKSPAEYEQYGAEVLKEDQAEHKNIE